MQNEIDALRDFLRNLDSSNILHMEIYKQIRYQFISEHEGVKEEAYDDLANKPVNKVARIQGKVTIGIGFNMDATGARRLWETVLQTEVDFDQAKAGTTSLNHEQIDKLFNASLEIRLQEIKRIYSRIFDQLYLNELLVLEDAYFNNPRLVNDSSNFYKQFHAYYETANYEYLKNAVNEIENRSNPQRIPGLQRRRNRKAKLLSVFETGSSREECITSNLVT